MKKNIFLIVVFLFASQFSQANEARILDASVTFACFKSPEQAYVEVYLHVLGNSLGQVPMEDSLFQSSVEVVILFKQEENIVKFDKYNLNSPVSAEKVNLFDLKRFGLDNGDYELEVSIRDRNILDNTKVYRSPLKIDFTKEGVLQSDIELLASFHPEESKNPAVKNGYYLEALPFNFYHKNISKLIFYNEIYNTDSALADEFLVRYSIEKVHGNGKTEQVLVGNKKRQPQSCQCSSFTNEY